MTMVSHKTLLLRRYVLERATGRVPRREFARYDVDLGVWIRCDEPVARDSEYWRRLRKPAHPWCDVLGCQTAIADDDALQAYFETIDPENWSSLAQAVRTNSSRCFRAWRDAGERILAAVSGTIAVGGGRSEGSLTGWPLLRGSALRSLSSQT
jgi:hypothetical protein